MVQPVELYICDSFSWLWLIEVWDRGETDLLRCSFSHTGSSSPTVDTGISNDTDPRLGTYIQEHDHPARNIYLRSICIENDVLRFDHECNTR